MIDEVARRALADLAMRSLDTIIEDYGEGAELTAASLVFEVRVLDGEEPLWHGNYKSLEGTSPHHVAGLLAETARQIMLPTDDA